MSAMSETVDNKVSILVLQHPQEQDRVLGTARLLAGSLVHAKVVVGLSWRNLAHALGEPAEPRDWGVLYLGSAQTKGQAAPLVAIDAKGQPRTVEFNCRLGDPEAQVILMRLKSDLFELLMHAAEGTLDQVQLQWDRRTALGVVMAAAGYPQSPRKGDLIHGGPLLHAGAEHLKVFHAGTVRDEAGTLRTSGGRVLCVTALGDSVRLAQARAYEGVRQIQFDGAQWRSDIGHRAVKH